MTTLPQAFDQLDAFIVRVMQTHNTPGLALALTDREKLLRVSAYGYADLARGTPVTPDTLFEIGSDGKAFTALALLRQAEAGRVDLHAPVSDYLPWFHVPSRDAPITAHHLLSHSAGIISGTEFATDGRYEAWALRETETASPPGTHHHYSNAGYKVLGLLLERVAEQPYGAIVQGGILDPLGMTATEPVITHATRVRLAVGYRPLYDDRPPHHTHPLVPAPWVETDTGDGCLVSTVGDMARYVRMLLNRGRGPNEPIVSTESFDRMTHAHSAIRPGVSYGYGLVMFELDGHACLRHGGDMPGYESTWCADQDAGLAAIVLMNGPLAPGIPPYAVTLLRAALEQGALPPSPLPEPGRVTHAAGYAGLYRAGDRTLALTAEGGAPDPAPWGGACRPRRAG